jgi:hypothetical protein
VVLRDRTPPRLEIDAEALGVEVRQLDERFEVLLLGQRGAGEMRVQCSRYGSVMLAT